MYPNGGPKLICIFFSCYGMVSVQLVIYNEQNTNPLNWLTTYIVLDRVAICLVLGMF